MITEEKWQEMKVAEKRDALREETGDLWTGIHRLEQHHRNFMRGGVDEMRSRYDALNEKADKMLAKVDHLDRVIFIMHGNFTSRIEDVEEMLGIVR